MSNGNSSELLGPGGEQQEEGTLIAQDIPGMQVQPQRNYMGLVVPILSSVGFAAAIYYLFIEGDE